MTRFTMTTDELIVLRGAPLTILCALILAKREGVAPVNQHWLKRNTRYGLDTINDALNLLKDRGYAIQTSRYAWLPADEKALQLPLMAFLDDGKDNDPSDDSEKIGVPATRNESQPANDSEKIGVPAIRNEVSPVNDSEKIGVPVTRNGASPAHDSEKIGVDVSNVIIDLNLSPNNDENQPILPIDSEKIGVDEKGRSSSSSSLNLLKNKTTTTTTAKTEDENFDANYAECKRWGIGNKDARLISKKSWVTPELIRAHCTTADNIGLAIHRIKDDWGIPAGWIDPDLEQTSDQPSEDPSDDPEPPKAAPEIQQTWLTVLEQLQFGDMPRGQFESYVHPLQPIGFRDGAFWVESANPYARDWCESRLSKVIASLLSGLYVQPVNVRFVLPGQSGS